MMMVSYVFDFPPTISDSTPHYHSIIMRSWGPSALVSFAGWGVHLYQIWLIIIIIDFFRLSKGKHSRLLLLCYFCVGNITFFNGLVAGIALWISIAGRFQIEIGEATTTKNKTWNYRSGGENCQDGWKSGFNTRLAPPTDQLHVCALINAALSHYKGAFNVFHSTIIDAI